MKKAKRELTAGTYQAQFTVGLNGIITIRNLQKERVDNYGTAFMVATKKQRRGFEKSINFRAK